MDQLVRTPVGGVPARPRSRRDAQTDRPGFSVAMSRALGMVVVTVHGELGAATSGQLRYILWDLIHQQGNRRVVLDLRDMTVGDGADLELFVEAARRAREGGGYLTLSEPCPAAVAAFARAGLIEALDVEPTGSCRPFSRPGR